MSTSAEKSKQVDDKALREELNLKIQVILKHNILSTESLRDVYEGMYQRVKEEAEQDKRAACYILCLCAMEAAAVKLGADASGLTVNKLAKGIAPIRSRSELHERIISDFTELMVKAYAKTIAVYMNAPEIEKQLLSVLSVE